MKIPAILALSLLSMQTLAGTFDYSDLRKGLFAPKNVVGVRSMNDGEHYTTRTGGKIERFRYSTGERVATVFDAETAGLPVEFKEYAFSADERLILLQTEVKPVYRHSSTAEYWIYRIGEGKLSKLSENGPQQEATFSPDGNRAAFVRDNNLFVVDLRSGEERQITTDGERNRILNGIPDWVYEEEFGFSRAFEWSPDGMEIAWMRFDESRVREFSMNLFEGQLYPSVYTYKYPKAGEENSVVEVWCCDLRTDRKVRIDLGSETEQYVPRIRWTARGDLAVFRLNRAQNHFEVLLADGDGNTRRIYDEINERYVDRPDDRTVTFLPDGDRFVVLSEREGFMHLYLYSVKKGFLNKITDGAWEVTQIVTIEGDEAYYLSTEGSPLRRNLYRIKLNGNGKKRLTSGEGTYSITPSKGFRYFISNFSNIRTPLQVTLHKADGTPLRTLENNQALIEKLQQRQVPVREFFTFRLPDGTELNGYLIKPRDFDASKRYPLFMTQYSGPGSQQVADRWSVGWEDVLVQDDYIVACVDGRGTGFRGEKFKKITYLNLGRYETEDQIEAARYLGSLPFIDPARIGIYGWSFGGFTALNCILKGNDIFKTAIAVAPVTSWRFYDTIYTEIYNGKPQDNPAGYDDNSPIHFADRLRGKLLIAHGTADDNVHVQNSYEMIEQLVQHDKPFEMYIYPDRNHGMGTARHHLMERCIEFVQRNL